MSEKPIQQSNESMLADAFSNRLGKQARIFSTWVIMLLITLGLVILVLVLNLIQPIKKARAKITL